MRKRARVHTGETNIPVNPTVDDDDDFEITPPSSPDPMSKVRAQIERSLKRQRTMRSYANDDDRITRGKFLLVI